MGIPRVEINGKIDTSQNVLANMNKIAASTQSFITWDPTTGNWTPIVNKAVAGLPLSATLFDDSNIVGSVTITGSGINELYNSARITYQSKDTNGRSDERVISIPTEDRFDRELDNELSLNFDLITDPVQAELLAAIELKQSRVDKIIEFFTDYRAIGLKPGDCIRVTNEALGFTNKVFRVVFLEETDTEDGGIFIKITGIEYDADVYDTSGLTRPDRVRETGFSPASENVCVIESDGEAATNQVSSGLATPTGLANITREQTYGSTEVGIPLFQTESQGWSSSQVSTVYGSGTSSSSYLETSFSTYRPIKNCLVLFEAPQGNMVLRVDGVNKSLTALGLPTVVYVYSRPFNADQGVGSGSYVLETTRYMEWSSYFTAISVAAETPKQFLIRAYALDTYDLSASNPLLQFISSSNYISNANGDYATLSVLAFLN